MVPGVACTLPPRNHCWTSQQWHPAHSGKKKAAPTGQVAQPSLNGDFKTDLSQSAGACISTLPAEVAERQGLLDVPALAASVFQLVLVLEARRMTFSRPELMRLSPITFYRLNSKPILERFASCRLGFQQVLLVWMLLSSMAVTGCRSGNFRANNLPPQYRASLSPGDVSVNMARMTGSGYDNSLIGPDDLLDVTIVTGRDDEKSIPVAARVAKDGTVDISPIGPVQVGNLDPVDASQEIAAAAVERGIYVQPNVTVEFKKKAVNHITVLGAVEEPGLHEVPRNSSDVVSAIALAGGLTEEAGTEVEIIRQHARANGNYTRFAEDQPANPVDSGSGSDAIMLAAYSSLAQQPTSAGAPSAQGGPLSQRINLAEVASRGSHGDYRLDDRDVVMVKSRPKRTIHVGGLVKTPGKFELPLAEDVRLLDAIALAGGCTSVVADKVFVIRPVKGRPQPVVIQASMQRAKHDGQENLVLSEGDMVSIEQTPTTAVFDTLSRLFHLTIGVTGNGIF